MSNSPLPTVEPIIDESSPMNSLNDDLKDLKRSSSIITTSTDPSPSLNYGGKAIPRIIVQTRGKKLKNIYGRLIKFHTKIADFSFYKVLRFNKKDFENFTKSKFFFLVILIITDMVVLITTTNLVVSHKEVLSMIVYCVLSVLFVILSFLFIIFRNFSKSFSFFVFMYSAFFVCGNIAYCIATPNRGFINNNLYFYYFLVPVINIFLDTFSLFWIVIYIFLCLAGILTDVYFNFEIDPGYLDDSKRWLFVVRMYQMYITTTLLVVILYYFTKMRKKSEINRVKKLTKCVEELDFDNSFINGLLRRKVLSSPLEKSLKKIVKNLKLYKSYLPNFDDMYLLSNSTTTTDSSTAVKQCSSNGSSLKNNSNSKSSLSSLDFTRESKKKDNGNKTFENIKDVCVFKRKVVILQVSLLINKFVICNENEVQCVFEEFIRVCLKEIKISRGSISNLWNNEIRVTWNAEKISVDSLYKACNTALRIQKRWLQNRINKEFAFSCKISCAILSDVDVFCGNFGVTDWKRFNVFGGDRIDSLYELKKFGNSEGYKVVIEGTDHVREKLKFEFLVFQVDYNFETGCSIFELLEVKKNKGKLYNSEWMYSIKDNLQENDNEINVVLELGWNLYKKKEFTKVVNLLKDIKDTDKYVTILLNKTLTKIKTLKFV